MTREKQKLHGPTFSYYRPITKLKRGKETEHIFLWVDSVLGSQQDQMPEDLLDISHMVAFDLTASGNRELALAFAAPSCNCFIKAAA